MLSVLIAATAAAALPPYEPPPMFNITASNSYDAGLQHGKLAGSRIRGWLKTDEMQNIIKYIKTADGAAAFSRMQKENTAAFPYLVRELEGMAKGAAVAVDDIWACTMINELESLMTNGGGQWPPAPNATTIQNKENVDLRAGHCSDVYAVADGGASKGFAHGHNEDWPGPIFQFWYFVAYTASADANDTDPSFGSCAGMVYPGGLVGWAGSWNSHGVYLTQNSLFPLRTLAGGLSSAFMQRDALCNPKTASKGLDAIIDAMTKKKPRADDKAGGLVGWSSGASINIVSLKEVRMANIEVHEDKHGVYELPIHKEPTAGLNYSHFNMYKHLEVGIADAPSNSTMHRQARMDSLPPPRSVHDVKSHLSDAADTAYPIFRNMTLATLVLDGKSGKLDVWCCHHASLGGGPPQYSWVVPGFFA